MGAEKICFVIMPISDQPEYEHDHFNLVYNDIIKIACKKAGYTAIRADEVKQTNLIHKDILQKILDAPMAICDLSSNNPNVLFELGIRQAFDKPTVLIKDSKTKSIFDLAPLRHTEYLATHKYRDVLNAQEVIKNAILSTEKASEDENNINSLINLLSLPSAATLKNNSGDGSSINYMILQQVSDIQQAIKSLSFRSEMGNLSENNDKDIFSLVEQLRLLINHGYPKSIIQNNYNDISNKVTELGDYLSKVEKERLSKELAEIHALIRE